MGRVRSTCAIAGTGLAIVLGGCVSKGDFVSPAPDTLRGATEVSGRWRVEYELPYGRGWPLSPEPKSAVTADSSIGSVAGTVSPARPFDLANYGGELYAVFARRPADLWGIYCLLPSLDGLITYTGAVFGGGVTEDSPVYRVANSRLEKVAAGVRVTRLRLGN